MSTHPSDRASPEQSDNHQNDFTPTASTSSHDINVSMHPTLSENRRKKEEITMSQSQSGSRAVTARTFTNSNYVDETAASLAASQKSTPSPRATQNTAEVDDRTANNISQDLPNLNFKYDNPTIRDYFRNNVGPLYGASSQQYLDNLAHHPQYQYIPLNREPQLGSTIQTGSPLLPQQFFNQAGIPHGPPQQNMRPGNPQGSPQQFSNQSGHPQGLSQQFINQPGNSGQPLQYHQVQQSQMHPQYVFMMNQHQPVGSPGNINLNQTQQPHSAPVLLPGQQHIPMSQGQPVFPPLFQGYQFPQNAPRQQFNRKGPRKLNQNVNNDQVLPHINNIINMLSQQNINNVSNKKVQPNNHYLTNVLQHPMLKSSIQKVSDKQSPNNKKKTPKESFSFPLYMLPDEVEEGLKNNTLFEGVLRINPKSFQCAFVTYKEDEQDIFIDGRKNRNRALDGDVVVVQVIDKEPVKDSEDDDDDEDGAEKKDDTIITEEGNDKEKRLHGKVVFIKEKVHPRLCSGQLRLMKDKNNLRALFVPRDSRVPRLNILKTSWPDNFYERANDYENTLFLAKITEWWHTKFAMGTIIKVIGKTGDLFTETMAILSENCLDVTPYSSKMKKFFPRLDFTIPEDEFLRREDCRSLCVFSVDPATCRDIDDAMSCRPMPNGNFEIGVHISDVTYFLKENNILDTKVAERATTVYLVEKAYHMLPEELCMLCSLFPGVDKLAFSVFWEITAKGKILSSRFAKTVINSCSQLAYEHAQSILDDEEITNFPEIYNTFTLEDIRCRIKVLGELSSMFRKKRFAGGALTITDRAKLNFKLDADTGMPVSFSIYESKPSHQLIEEFMLLANMTVAKRIYEDHPDLAFLRCHPKPKLLQLRDLQKKLNSIGIELNIDSAGSFFKSIVPHIGSDCENDVKAVVLSMMCTKPMTRAKYFCAHKKDDEYFGHYALNVPLYTHFTSPIRRYADIMVHRLLSASINYSSAPDWNVERVCQIAANCNAQKYNAKRAGEKSMELYTLKYIELNSPVRMDAAVCDVKAQYIEVMVVAMGLNRRVYVDDIPGAKSELIKGKHNMNKMKLHWPATGATPEINLTLELFSVVQVEMTKGEDIMKVDTKLVRPL